MDIVDLIDQCVALKSGCKEMALHRWSDDGEWLVQIGNTCPHVWLGESDGEFEARGTTLREALERLRDQLTSAG